MGERLPWVLFAASLLLNAVFLAGAVFGWTTLKAPFLADSSGLTVVTQELSLSPEQAAAMQVLRQDFASRRKEMKQSRGARRGRLLAALAEESFDRPALDAMMTERSAERRTFFADMAEALHGYLQSLSPEQRERFLELAAEPGFLRKVMFDGKGRRASRD